MSEQIKKWCEAIQFHEDNLDLGTHKTLKMIVDHARKLEAQRDAAIKDHIRCCETNNHNARMYGECKQLLQKHGIHMVSKECWCYPIVGDICYQEPDK